VNIRHDGGGSMRQKLVGCRELREARTRTWGKREIWGSLRRKN
jgi:hypothetical protein